MTTVTHKPDGTVRRVEEHEPITKAQFVYKNIGPGMEHNYLCAVCRDKSAVVEMWHGILQPCWSCQNHGFKLIRLNWIDRLFRRGVP